MIISLEAEQAFKRHALEQYPKEACGLVINGDTFVPMRNTHENPRNDFRIEEVDMLPYLQAGNITALLHSHTGHNNNYPSRKDMKVQIGWAIPWGIVHINEHRDMDGVFFFGDQVPIAPYIGRPFRFNVHDCYVLGRDWFRQERGITLPVYPREGEWWLKGENLIEKNFKKAGFINIDRQQIKPGDVMLMNFADQSKQPGKVLANHVGIIVDKGQLLHHYRGRVSKHDPVQMWLPAATMFLRYAGAPAGTPAEEDTE